MSIEDKIRKLLAKARGTDSEEEAAAFVAKAHSLLAEHNLELAAVDVTVETGEVVGQSRRRASYSADWLGWLYMGAAALYFCRAYQLRETDIVHGSTETVRYYVLVGKPHNVAVAEAMVDYLATTVARLGKDYARGRKAAGNYLDDSHLFALWAGFEEGCAGRLRQRLEALAEEARAPAPALAPGAAGGLPALYAAEHQQIKSYLAAQGIHLRKGGPAKTYGTNDAKADGRRAGNAVSLAPQVAPGARTALLGAGR